MSVSRGKKQQSSALEVAYQQLIKTERVVRFEAERREAKARLRLMDDISTELDDQLLYVAQFKKQWLQHRQALENERQTLCREESAKRYAVQSYYWEVMNRLAQSAGGH